MWNTGKSLMRMCAVGGVLALLAGAAVAAGVDDLKGRAAAPLPNFSTDGDVQITADVMGVDRQSNRAMLDRNVCVRFGDLTLRCDHASYDTATGQIHAEGNVSILSDSGGSWYGQQIDFNHRTGEGLIGRGTLRVGCFTADAEDTVRDEDGIYHARRATITTCTHEPDAWHWAVSGTGRYKDGEFVELSNAVGYLWGFPILWAPFYYRDLNTNYGWRFKPGYTSKWGAYVRAGYVYPIAGSTTRNNLLYGKTLLDVRSKFGVGVGQELSWSTEGIFGEDTRQSGRLLAYYANHHDDQDAEDVNWQSSYTDHRWSLGLYERLDFSPRDFLSISGDIVSDSQFRTDYNEVAVRSASQPLGIVNYEHRENGWVASLAAMGPLRSFYAGTRRLPEFRFDFLPRSILGIQDLYYESQTSLGYFRRQPAKYDTAWREEYRWQPGPWAYYDTFRFDTRHILRRPFALADGITLTPRLGWRGTYYGDSDSGDAIFRSLFELGFTLQARYWRDFETIRHTVLPYIDLTWVPASRQSESKTPYAFDRLDQEYEWRDRYRSDGLTPSHRYAGLRLGVRNILQQRTEDDALSLIDILNLDLYGVYVFQTEDHWVRNYHRRPIPRQRMKEETGLRVLGLSGTYRPFKNFLIDSDFQYDPEESRLALWDVNAKYELSALTLYIGYLTRNHSVFDTFWADTVKDSLVYGGFIHHLCETIDWSLYCRYNTEREDLEEVGGFLQYNLDCVSFRLNLAHLPSYRSEDGYKHDSDVRVSFDVWLRAFPKTESEDWMMWGDLANRTRLEE